MGGRPCTVCKHPDRRDMEQRVSRGESAQSVASHFDVPARALQRHLASHATRSMEKAAVAIGMRDLASGLGLTEEAAALQDRTLAILTRAEKQAKTHTRALLAIREARANLELLGKFTGKLRPDTQVNVLVTSPDWLAMRERIGAALGPYPEAREAVMKALADER